jgi:hypothetical protein
MKKIGIICCFLSIASALALAQPTVDQLVKKTLDFNTTHYQEKVFIHLDRSFYLTGETAWFKVYLVDGIAHQPASTSTVVYLEILDRDNTPIIQTKVSIQEGKGNGSIALPASLGSDNYIVRAYTNWMKNFDSDFYYQQSISIVNPFRSLTKTEKKAESKLDIQFFPEGGQLVNGIKSKIACRVVSETGHGVDYRGFILSVQGDTITRFKPLKFGVGNFEFKPDLNESYQVVITHKGNKHNAKLPSIQSSGYVMHVTDTSENRFYVKVRSKGKEGATQIHLIAHTRQVIKFTSTQNLVNGTADLIIPKNTLGKGISSLTIFNSELKPVSERLVFIQPDNKIPVSIASEKSTYAIRNKIQLTISARQKVHSAAHLSLAVYKNDSLQNDVADIQSSLWLTSELKGNIETPGYYFSDDVNTSKAMDNLMLTHGWSRFSWEDAGKQSEPKFLPELRGHLVSGTIKDRASRNPMQGVTTYLAYPDKSIQVYEDISGQQGDFLFETRNLLSKKKLFIQTSQPDSLIRIEVLSPFSNQFSSQPITAINVTNEMANPLTARSVSMQVSDAFKTQPGNSNLSSDSSSFYGKPDEHYDLDEYTRFPVMEEVMREYVKGVRLRKKDGKFIFRVNDNLKSAVFDNEPLVLLDGVPIFNTDKFMTFDPLKVKSIDVMTGKYYLGALSFDGVVSYKTYTHDLGGYQFSANTFTFDYEGLQAQKEFFSPRYETKKEQESRLPDARHLLFWAPDITLFNEQKQLDFYSSDQPGIYKAFLQGISEDGNPIVEQCTFTVTPYNK